MSRSRYLLLFWEFVLEYCVFAWFRYFCKNELILRCVKPLLWTFILHFVLLKVCHRTDARISLPDDISLWRSKNRLSISFLLANCLKWPKISYFVFKKSFSARQKCWIVRPQRENATSGISKTFSTEILVIATRLMFHQITRVKSELEKWFLLYFSEEM